MGEDEKYLFDLHGYLVLEGVLDPSEIAAANAAIDAHADELELDPVIRSNGSRTLAGDRGRRDLTGFLEWEKPHCEVFRSLIVHPRLSPSLHELLGEGFRFCGSRIMVFDEGAEGFWFHEGAEPMDRSRSYIYRNGRMYCGMTQLMVLLSDVGPADGGFSCVPGSHKANFPAPDEMRLYHKYQDRFQTITGKAGDAVLFVEALMHGSLPWRAAHQRRLVLMGYFPGSICERPADTAPAYFDELTEEQQAALAPPGYRGEDKGSILYETEKSNRRDT